MNYPPYPFESLPDGLIYAFESRSNQRTIQKYVIFTPIDSRCYNLALVDLEEDGRLSDTTVSNNDDLERVLSTVIQIILKFLNHNLDCEVSFAGSTPERTRLYRIVINKYINDFSDHLSVDGILPEQSREAFKPNRPYLSFVLSLT